MIAAALVPIAAVMSAAATVASRALATRLAFLSHPNPFVSAHTRPVSYLGGPAIAAGTLATLAALDAAPPIPGATLTGACLFLAVGLLDDARPLAPLGKLALQTGCAAVAVSLGLRLPISGLPIVDALAAALVILLVVNAVNLTDVCDGLVAGLAAIAFLALAAVEPAATALSLAAAGACLGFLIFNAPPASIFLGDAGTHLLGFLLSVPLLSNPTGDDAWDELVAGTLILGVPFFELVFLIVARTRRGAPWWQASADHFSLRLQAAGLRRWATDGVAWLTAAMLAAAGLAVLRLDVVVALMLFAAVFAGLTAIGRLLLAFGPSS